MQIPTPDTGGFASANNAVGWTLGMFGNVYP
jgi:hypothetical protein